MYLLTAKEMSKQERKKNKGFYRCFDDVENEGMILFVQFKEKDMLEVTRML